MNADDRLSLDPLGRVEGGDRIVEGSQLADVCPQPTIPDPLDELTQLGAIGDDDEADSQAAIPAFFYGLRIVQIQSACRNAEIIRNPLNRKALTNEADYLLGVKFFSGTAHLAHGLTFARFLN